MPVREGRGVQGRKAGGMSDQTETLAAKIACNREADLALLGMPRTAGTYVDPFVQWAADLGRREGEFVRRERGGGQQ